MTDPHTPSGSQPPRRSLPIAVNPLVSAKFCNRNLAELLRIMDGRTFIPGTIEREIVIRSGEVMTELVALVEEMRAALHGAVEAIEKGGLDDRMCCDGHMCGCRGSSNADFLLHCLRETINKATEA